MHSGSIRNFHRNESRWIWTKFSIRINSSSAWSRQNFQSKWIWPRNDSDSFRLEFLNEPDWFLNNLHQAKFKKNFGLVRKQISEWLWFARIEFQFEDFSRDVYLSWIIVFYFMKDQDLQISTNNLSYEPIEALPSCTRPDVSSYRCQRRVASNVTRIHRNA